MDTIGLSGWLLSRKKQEAGKGILDVKFCTHFVCTFAWVEAMRTTINLDDALLARAQQLSGLPERGQVLREALIALIQRESARRLARLGGTEPQLRLIPRRRVSS